MNEHWTDDEATLDAYLRDELPPVERARFQEHLGACEQCRLRVEREHALIGGIRSVGREELKGALRSMLAERSSRRAMTVRWLAAAAVVAIILTVWQYPFETDAPRSFTDVPKTDTTSDGVPRSESRPEEDVASPDAGRAAEQPRMTRPTIMTAPRREILSDAAASGAGVVTPAGEERERVSEIADLTDETEEVTWSTAVVYSGTSERKDEMPAVLQAQKMERQQAAEAVDDRISAGPDAHIDLSHLRLEQSVFAATPLEVQRIVQVQDAATIPIRVQHTDDSTVVTVFPKVQWKASEIRNSVATAIGDSVQVQVGAQFVRFGSKALRRSAKR